MNNIAARDCLKKQPTPLTPSLTSGAPATEAAFEEAKGIAEQLLARAEQFTTPPPADLVSRRVLLACNQECGAMAEERARQARNLALASGLGLADKDISGSMQDDDAPEYSDFAVEHVSTGRCLDRWSALRCCSAADRPVPSPSSRPGPTRRCCGRWRAPLSSLSITPARAR